MNAPTTADVQEGHPTGDDEPVEGRSQGVEPSAGGSKAAEESVSQESEVTGDKVLGGEERLPEEGHCVTDRMEEAPSLPSSQVSQRSLIGGPAPTPSVWPAGDC